MEVFITVNAAQSMLAVPFHLSIAHAVHMVPCEGRLIQLWMYYRNGDADDNHYAHPLDFIPVVDLNLKKVRLCTLGSGHYLLQVPSRER